MRPQKGASFCYLTCLVCVFYQLYKASTKEMILKNSRAISISVTLHIYTSNKLTILAQLLTGLRVCTEERTGQKKGEGTPVN